MVTMLQVNNLKKEYGPQTIFQGLSFSVGEKQKIGIIGKNGAGKSTIFRLILGNEVADEGSIIIGPTTRLGHLEQEDAWLADESALEYLRRISQQEDWTIKKLASRFELNDEKLAQPAHNLSGGWRMRLKLTAMLLMSPNLFLLDEPTNYLDLNTLILLEKYLKSYKGSFLIISHDREFIKNTCNETIEIYNGGCYHYPGPIEDYLAFKESKLKTIIKQNEGLASQQEHMREFVDRFRASASKAKQAQAMIRKIEKLEAKRITIEHEAGITRITIPEVPKRKSMALRVKKLTVGYNQPLLKDIEFDVSFGERIAILGLNGQGKTTLLRTLTGQLKPLSGTYHWYSEAEIGYHSQDSYDILNRHEQTGVYLRRIASPDIKTEKVLKMAGDFLFDEDDLKKPIGVLSGGEKSRLILAGILLAKPDILILDEPTSHLDFETVEALGRALKKYHGAIIFTSHDRTFTNLLVTSLVEVANGQAVRRFQNYEDYIQALEDQLSANNEVVQTKNSNNDKALAYQAKKESQKQLDKVEKKLNKLRQQQAEIIDYFSKNPTNYHVEKMQILSQLNREIVETENEWLRLAVRE